MPGCACVCVCFSQEQKSSKQFSPSLTAPGSFAGRAASPPPIWSPVEANTRLQQVRSELQYLSLTRSVFFSPPMHCNKSTDCVQLPSALSLHHVLQLLCRGIHSGGRISIRLTGQSRCFLHGLPSLSSPQIMESDSENKALEGRLMTGSQNPIVGNFAVADVRRKLLKRCVFLRT